WARREYGAQAVVGQPAVTPVVALELIEGGAWSGSGVLGPEALPPRPFLDLLTEYGSPWACEEGRPGRAQPVRPGAARLGGPAWVADLAGAAGGAGLAGTAGGAGLAGPGGRAAGL